MSVTFVPLTSIIAHPMTNTNRLEREDESGKTRTPPVRSYLRTEESAGSHGHGEKRPLVRH